MAKRFTPAQESAINEQSKTLLVSAAAGSGKTTTLIERILRSVTRKDNPLMLDRLLVVTFTKAAASELRLRISAALSNAIAESGGDEVLARQIALLPSAKISTIDSFCLNLVRSNFAALGLSPSFRMADDGESALIASETMEQLINECYDDANSKICGGPRGFAALVDTLLGASDDKRLSGILLALGEKLAAYPKGAAALYEREKELREYAKHDFFECEHGKRIEKFLLSFFEYYRRGYLYCLDIIALNEKLAKAYSPYYEEDLHNIFAIEKALKEGYSSGKAAIEGLTFSSIKGGYRG
ncbi:MAG: UvrD-helicase domain-containing protein, partial [Clostridia bacterium]|nr:UvrD-helicase domain-containing protein [Clostridia bacterium]